VVSPKPFLKDKDQKQQQMESLEIEMRLTQSRKKTLLLLLSFNQETEAGFRKDWFWFETVDLVNL